MLVQDSLRVQELIHAGHIIECAHRPAKKDTIKTRQNARDSILMPFNKAFHWIAHSERVLEFLPVSGRFMSAKVHWNAGAMPQEIRGEAACPGISHALLAAQSVGKILWLRPKAAPSQHD